MQQNYTSPASRPFLPADFGPITKIAQRSYGCPTALLTVVSEGNEIWREGLPAGYDRVGICCSFCIHVIRTGAPLVVLDATRDPRFQNSILVRGYPGIRFYAGVPVEGCDGQPAAVLCVVDYTPRPELDAVELDTLLDLAELAAERLAADPTCNIRVACDMRVDPAGSDEAVLLVDDDAGIVNWNSAAERLLAAFADDLFEAGAHRHLPNWDHLASAAVPADGRASPAEPRLIPLVRADGSKTAAVATVTRHPNPRGPRYRVVLQHCPAAPASPERCATSRKRP